MEQIILGTADEQRNGANHLIITCLADGIRKNGANYSIILCPADKIEGVDQIIER